MSRALIILSCVCVLSAPSVAVAQAMTPPAGPPNVTPPAGAKPSEAKPGDTQPGPRFVRSLTNVQVELTLTDQLGTGAPQKKTVSMIVASGSLGKIRNTAARIGPTQIGLNVDARPFVSTEGPIQLELTLYYYPPQGDEKDPGMPTELNQSLTVVLQSGKPLVVSQAADPVSDRKVVVEVKATVLK
jgi:hypothetical protein